MVGGASLSFTNTHSRGGAGCFGSDLAAGALVVQQAAALPDVLNGREGGAVPRTVAILETAI